MIKNNKIKALYNIYTQLLLSDISLIIGGYDESIYGKILLRVNLKNSQWSFNYFSYFLFYFNSKYRFCSYIMGVYNEETSDVDLVILLDHNEVAVSDYGFTGYFF